MGVKGNTLYSSKVRNSEVYMLALIAFGILTVVLIAYFAYSANYLASLIFTLVGFILIASFFQNKSRITTYGISTTGVQVDNILYPYEHLKSFWIFSDPRAAGITSGDARSELSIKSKKAITGYIRMPIDKNNEQKIRELLLDFIPEKKHKETLSEVFMKMLGL